MLGIFENLNPSRLLEVFLHNLILVRTTVGDMDTWGFIGLMVALCLVILFLLFVILRKYSKSESRTEDVSAITRENSQVSLYINYMPV